MDAIMLKKLGGVANAKMVSGTWTPSVDTNYTSNVNITHNLGYIPKAFIMYDNQQPASSTTNEQHSIVYVKNPNGLYFSGNGNTTKYNALFGAYQGNYAGNYSGTLITQYAITNAITTRATTTEFPILTNDTDYTWKQGRTVNWVAIWWED